MIKSFLTRNRERFRGDKSLSSLNYFVKLVAAGAPLVFCLGSFV